MTLGLLSSGGFDAVQAIARSGPVAALTLLALAAMSVASWATFISRRRALKRALHDSRRARENFVGAEDTGVFAEDCRRRLPGGPVPRMFFAAHEPYLALVSAIDAAGARDGVRVEAGRQLLARTLSGARNREVLAARRGLSLLATVGATAPFVGLFGTVWGVMKAFGNIGAQRSAELAVVAPGIAEALIATAAGLAVAVPAVWFYNALVSTARSLAGELEGFGEDFLNAYDWTMATGASPAREAPSGATKPARHPHP